VAANSDSISAKTTAGTLLLIAPLLLTKMALSQASASTEQSKAGSLKAIGKAEGSLPLVKGGWPTGAQDVIKAMVDPEDLRSEDEQVNFAGGAVYTDIKLADQWILKAAMPKRRAGPMTLKRGCLKYWFRPRPGTQSFSIRYFFGSSERK